LGAALTEALRWASERAMAPEYAVQLTTLGNVFRVADALLPETLATRLMELAEPLIAPIRWPGAATRRLQAARAVIEQRVERMIAERRETMTAGHRADGGTAPRRDLLSLLLAARGDESGRMSDRQVRDEIVTLFVAGHETTANTLAWSLYL